jgi:hypothetical protein
MRTGETLLWSAKPDLRHVHIPWLRLLPGLIFLGSSAILVYAGVTSTIESVASKGASGYGALLICALAIPFIVAGISVLRDLFRVWTRLPHEVYAMSNLRLMIASNRYHQDFREIPLDAVCGIQRWDRKDGHAAFEIEDNRQANRELVFRIFLLDGVANADAFEALIERAASVPVTSKRNARSYTRIQGRGADVRF